MMEHLINLKESLICNICQKKFDRERDLKQHYSHHDVLTCDVCEKVFNHPKNLKKHYRVHTGDKPYECEICLRRFVHPTSFSRHCRTHSEKKEFSCHVCKMQFYTKNQLDKHKDNHGNQNSFNCGVCLKIFSSLDQLTEHLSTHSTQKSFVCNLCPRKFTYKKALVKHYQTHILKCNKCTKEFYTNQELKRHACGKPSLTKVCTKKKLSDIKTLKVRNQICEEEEIYKCKECEKKYISKKSFQRHLLIHGKKHYTCDVCNKSFFRKDHFQKHHKRHTEKISYKWKKCSKAIFSSTTLSDHKLIHTKAKGSRPKKSKECLHSQSDVTNDYSSIENSSIPYVLLEKLNIYDTEKSYLIPKESLHACDECNRRFTKKCDLKRHDCTVHNKKKSYRCKRSPKSLSVVASHNKQKPIHIKRKGSVLKKYEESLDLQSDFKNHYSCVEPDSNFEKLPKSKYSYIKTKKKKYECKISKKKYNYKNILQKYFPMRIVGKSFTCDVCNKRFHRQDIFESHCLNHCSVKPYECKDCGKGFIYKSNLRQHMINHKSKKLKSSFCCKVCMKTFSTMYNLKRHGKIHNKIKSHICNICQKVFANAKLLKYHCQSFKGKQAYGCSECEKRFHLRQGLNKHLPVHKKISFQCEKCLKKFVSQKSLQAHKNILCDKKSSAKICDAFSGEASLNKTQNPCITDSDCLHEINNKDNNICNICQKSFANSRLFKYHLDTYKGKQTYDCTKCVKKFHQKQSLTKHLLIHNTNSLEQLTDVNGREKTSNNIQDTFHDESRVKKQLNPYIKGLEQQNGLCSEDNICNICQKSFANSRLFQYHLDTYKGKQIYECSECVKKFHLRQSLNKHLLTHNAKSFQCNVCHKTFADTLSLQQHIHILIGDTSYECNVEDVFRGESIKNLINEGLNLNKKLNLCTTEKPCMIYISKEIQK